MKLIKIILCFPELALLFVINLQAQPLKLTLPKGHASEVRSAVFSPDGRRVLTASDDYTARVWDVATGSMLQEFKHADAVNSAVFSADGKSVLTASSDQTARISEVLSGQVLHTFSGSRDVRSAVFSPDGSKVLTLHEEVINIWDVPSRRVERRIGPLQSYENQAEFSSDGKWVITTSRNHIARIWSVSTGKLHELKDENGSSINFTSATFTPDNKKLVTTSTDLFNRVWEISTGKVLSMSKSRGGWIFPNAFARDGKKFLTASDDFRVRINQIGNETSGYQLGGHKSAITAMSFNRDDTKVLTASWDGSIKIWEANTGKLLQELVGHTGVVSSAVFSSDGNKVLSASDDYTAKIWDVASGNILQDLRGHTSVIVSGTFSADGTKILTAHEDHTARIWDVTTGGITQQFNGHSGLVQSAVFSPDGRRVLTASDDGTSKIWDIVSGTLLRVLKADSTQMNLALFSPDGTKVLTVSSHGKVVLWEASTGNKLREFTGHSGAVESAVFSPDGKLIVTCSEDRTMKIWEAATGKLSRQISSRSMFMTASFSPDGKRILSRSRDDTARIWDVSSGRLEQILTAAGGRLRVAVYSPDGSQALISSEYGASRIWDLATGKPVTEMYGHSSIITSACFSPDGKKILTTAADMTGKLWDAKTGQLFYTFLALDSTDYFIQISTGFYHSTQSAAKLLYYITKDLNTVTFEQLDTRYNRPDKVLSAIGSTDTAQIRYYYLAYLKRIKNLNLDTAAFKDGFNVPNADFVNRNEVAYEQTTDKIKLRIKAQDSTFNLDRFNIWVNEVPVYGKNGIAVLRRKSKLLDTTITISLSNGENKVETSVLNINGTESYRMPLHLKYTPPRPKTERLFFVGIGIDQYSDSSQNLQYCSKDIRNLTSVFKKKYGDAAQIDTLLNEQVTTDQVKAIKRKLMQCKEDDKVVIAYAGHGLLSKGGNYFLGTYNLNFSDPEQRGLPYEELENLLDDIKSRKKLLLIDACHSGEVDKESLGEHHADKTSLGRKVFRSGNEMSIIEPASGSPNTFELMRQLFADVSRGTGATVIAAARGVETASEYAELKNGVFTYSVLEMLQAHLGVTVGELKNYVSKRVIELTKGKQQPTTRNEPIDNNWKL